MKYSENECKRRVKCDEYNKVGYLQIKILPKYHMYE
jgi:hypothetical protein